MTSFVLILTAWYTIISEPEGSWRYVQTFGWFDNQPQCEQHAKDEMKTAEEFTIPFKTPFETRKMVLKEMTYECLTADEYADRLRKGI